MEAGYDYLLTRRRFRRLIRYGGIGLVALGVALLAGGLTFFLAFGESTEDLQNKFNVSITSTPTPSPSDPAGELAQARSQDQSTPTPQASPTATPASPSPTGTPSSTATPSPEATATPSPGSETQLVVPVHLSPGIVAAAQLYPGENLRAVHWADPLSFEPVPDASLDVIEGFQPIDITSIPPRGTLAPPERLIIPSIEVDSQVEGLRIFDLGDSRAYETPKNIVGHIPETANPGELGTSWLFGHLESPIRNEGNVFAQLPKIPGLIRRWINGGMVPEEAVYAIVESGGRAYLYRIIESEVVPQEDLKLVDDGSPSLVMVTCVPRFIYDHRLVVKGELVGMKVL